MAADTLPAPLRRIGAAWQRIPEWAVVAAIVAVAAALRLWNLSANSLWVDETHTLHVANRPALDVLRFPDESPPLNYFVMHFAIAAFGTSEWGLRIVPALLSTASVGLMAPVAKRIVGARAMPAAVFLLAVSPLHVQLGREARTYPLVMVLLLASTWALLRWRERPTPARSAVHMGLLFLLLHTHVYGTLIAVTHGLVVLRWFRRDAASAGANGDASASGWPPRHWWVAQLVVAAAAAPWYLFVFLDRADRVAEGFWIPRPGIGSILATIRWQTGRYLIAPVWAAVIAWGLWRRRDGTALPLAWWFAITGVTFLFSLVGPPIFTARYTILAVPAVILLLVHGMRQLPARVGVVAVALVLAVGAVDGVQESQHPARGDWRGVTRDIEANAAPGAYVLFHEALCDDRRDDDWFCVPDYYATRDDLHLRSILGLHRTRSLADSAPIVAAWLANESQAWLVVDHLEDEDMILDFLHGIGWESAARRPYGLMAGHELRPVAATG